MLVLLSQRGAGSGTGPGFILAPSTPSSLRMHCVSAARAPHWWSCFPSAGLSPGLSPGFHPDAAPQMWDPDSETLTFVRIPSLSAAATL